MKSAALSEEFLRELESIENREWETQKYDFFENKTIEELRSWFG